MQFHIVSLTNASDLQVQQKLFQIGMLSYFKIISWQEQLFLVIRKIIDQTHAHTWKNPSSAFSGHQKKFHLMQLKKPGKGMNSSD